MLIMKMVYLKPQVMEIGLVGDCIIAASVGSRAAGGKNDGTSTGSNARGEWGNVWQ